jgi:hypothetical protein
MTAASGLPSARRPAVRPFQCFRRPDKVDADLSRLPRRQSRPPEPGQGSGKGDPDRPRTRSGAPALHEHDISFQRTRTWKISTDSAYDAKLDRIDEVTSRFPGRCFAFDQFGPLRTFTTANSHYPNHTALARAPHAYPRWRNANNRHPEVIAAQRRERARARGRGRSRSEHHHRWGQPATRAA